jgi:hypothetical protein
LVVIALVAGVVVGAAGVGAAWLVSSSTDGSGAASDARMACQTLDRVGTVDLNVSKSQIGRIRAAKELAAAAAEADRRYLPLSEKATSIERGMVVFDLEVVNSGISQARGVCADLA